jgi:hypothetical protein
MQNFREGKELPPLITVTGRVSNNIYLIDGNTRALAATIVWLANGRTNFPKLEMYIGRKPYLRSNL